MPKQLLHCPDIRAALENMGSKTVAQGMNADLLGNPGLGYSPL